MPSGYVKAGAHAKGCFEAQAVFLPDRFSKREVQHGLLVRNFLFRAAATIFLVSEAAHNIHNPASLTSSFTFPTSHVSPRSRPVPSPNSTHFR